MWWWLLSCVPSSPPTAPPNTPTEWQFEPTEVAPSPPLTSEELEAVAIRWLGEMASLDPQPLFDDWERTSAFGDGTCPKQSTTYFDGGTASLWLTPTCQSTSGATFSGYSEYSDITGEEEDGWWARRQFLWASADTETPDGWTFHGLGLLDSVERWRPLPSGAVEHYHAKAVVGEMVWGAPEAPLTFQPGAPHHQTNSKREWVTGDGGSISLEAWVSGDLGPANGISAVHFTVVTDSWATCFPNEPSGEVSIRDRAGTWYTLRFHGGDPSQPGACDGCADVMVHDEVTGSLCLDLNFLVADLEPQ